MARLPVPGSDDDTWGDILNEFLAVSHDTDGTLLAAPTITGAVQQSLFDAKGDLLVATANDTAAKLPVGSNGQVLTADSTQATGVKWATPAAGGVTTPGVYPLTEYGLVGLSASVDAFRGTDLLFGALFARIFVPAGTAITAVGTVIYASGTVGAGGLNGVAVYSDAGTLLSSSVSDNTMYQTTGWVFKPLSATIPAQGADRFVYGAISSFGYSAQPSIQYVVTDPAIVAGGGYLVSSHYRSFGNVYAAAWPASVDPTTGGSLGSELPLIALA
ncbi:MAG TPA: hypothetical protein VLF40_04315 [Candidatus Saccharimonadales bacterium]|nr:hypothetical protein [Candidatus Saccharimonadales bacterium]